MHPTLLVDAFGFLNPIPERVAPDPESPNEVHESLWSTFLDRSVHMRWSTEGSAGTPRVWDVQEAELAYHLGSSRIGFAQVGLEVKGATAVMPPKMSNLDELTLDIDLSQAGWAAVPTLDDAAPSTPPAVAISPLIQCLDDSLRWYGETEVTAYQVTGYDLLPESADHFLSSVLGWFRVPVPSDITPVIVTLASSHRADTLVSEVLSSIQGTGFHFFEFGPLVDVPADYTAGLDWGWLGLERGQIGVAVTLPEWSTAAAGWLIAQVFDVVLSLESPPQALSVRVTRYALE